MERNLLYLAPKTPIVISDPCWQARLAQIKWIVTDVDGVLTDGTIWLEGESSELKGFSVRDGIGVWLAQQSGIHIAVLTGRLTPVVKRRTKELGILHVLGRPIDQKRNGMLALMKKHQFTQSEVLYIGDDLIDLPVFPEVAIAIAPADADHNVLQFCDATTSSIGGKGVLREVVEAILRAQNKWDPLLQKKFDLDLTGVASA